MKDMNRLVIRMMLVAGTGLTTMAENTFDQPLTYPDSAKVRQVDDYFGTTVEDPYRWLEDNDSQETRDWVSRQAEFTTEYLSKLPGRQAIRERITELWNYEKFGVPFLRGDRTFYYYNSGLQNQSVLYVRDSGESEGRILIDPNKLSEDGTVALSGISISDDGQWLAYAISRSGSDWKEWRIRNIATGKDLDDQVKWAKFSGASWDKSGKGFYYSRYDEPASGSEFDQVNYFQKLYYHTAGTPQSEDILVYERPDNKEWGFSGNVSEDGRYLIISVWQGTDPRNRVFYKDLKHPEKDVVELLNDFDAEYSFQGNDGEVFWFKTDLDAPRGRVIAINIAKPDRSEWKTLIDESDATLASVNVVGGHFVAQYLEDAKSQVSLYKLDGTLRMKLPLPGIGSVSGFGGRQNQERTWYSFTSFNTPGTIYEFNFQDMQSRAYIQPKLKFDPSDYVTRQVFYTSRDGTKVPMFIVHKKDLDTARTHPTYLYGYGGFSISLPPRFSVTNLAWMEMGGIYAQANLRGGGEYGEDWHLAGTKLNKQNVFDDFIAAAEYLIDEKLTDRYKLAIGGGSNGGLLVGACVNQRPDLFRAAIPAVGVMDMLRFQKFTIGWAWTSDYGSSEASEQEFKALYAYSPYHNLKPGTIYPSVLVTTADTDDRVVPAHSFKYAARLQECHAGSNPVLIRIETKAGHGAGKPTSKIIEEAADKWAFILSELD